MAEYWQRLALMAPADVTAFYLTFRGFMVSGMTPQQVQGDWLTNWWPWVCTVLAVVARAYATRGGRSLATAQPGPVIVAAIAFLLWVLAMGHPVAGISQLPIMQDLRVPAILAALFTFLVPYFYTGTPPDRPQGT